jgi:uncharacterized integral membrane protein
MINRQIYTFFLTIILLLTQVVLWAQDTKPVEMATGMRANGKIYVVVAVLLTVLAGLLLYVIRLDLKISKIEKQG